MALLGIRRVQDAYGTTDDQGQYGSLNFDESKDEVRSKLFGVQRESYDDRKSAGVRLPVVTADTLSTTQKVTL
jgi:hypothetical protein